MRFETRLLATLICAATLTFSLTPAASAETYTIDPGHSSAMFKIRHFGVSNVYGAFWDVAGTVTYDGANPEASSIQVTITAESLDTNSERRDNHIKSPDFLDAKQFPEIKFESTAVKSAGDGQLEVTGEFTMHGVTREITVMAELVGEGEHPRSGNKMIGFESMFTVDRTTFDMNFMAGPLGTDVTILLSFEAGVN